MEAQRRMTGLLPCAIVAMGVSGCGKSTLVAHLAAHLAAPAFEGDDFHSAASVAKMRAGRPLDDNDRRPWLDRLGLAVNASLIEGCPVVLACSALKRQYRDRLRAAIYAPVSVVWLEAGREALEQRLVSRTGHYMPASLLESQLAALEPPGCDETALTLDAGRPVDDLYATAAQWLLIRSDQA